METYGKYLKNVYFFRDLPDPVLAELETLCHEEIFEPGRIVFEEGSAADKFYIILSGSVEVWKDYYDSRRDLLAVHGEGHLFGEMALIDELPRSATLKCRERTRVLFLFRDDFHRLIMENQAVAHSIMKWVSSMVRRSNEHFVDGLRKQNEELQQANRELKEAQADLLRAERLSTLGRFSSLILHDIRNPISTLRGYAELIMLHLNDPERVERAARYILQESDRINRLANELLDYSRGEVRLNMKLIEPSILIAQVLEAAALRLEAREIRVVQEIGLKEPVIMDEERMFRVFTNLLDNARKAMPRGGTLTIRAYRENGFACLEVEDTGIGMSREVQRSLFEPFYSHSPAGGTGLGMLIVKNVVEAHSGMVIVRSRELEGTKVTVRLPHQQ